MPGPASTRPPPCNDTPPKVLGPTKAEYCPHHLHPGGPQDLSVCPSCTTTHRLKVLQKSTEVWNQNGGPLHDPEKDKPPLYLKLARTWSSDRAILAKHMDRVELWAEQEQEWEVKNPGVIESLKKRWDICTAQEALAVARKNIPYTEWMDNETNFTTQADQAKRPRKSVSWGSGTEDSPKRKLEAFQRSHSSYKPGNWASKEGAAWLNTSFFTDARFGTPEFDKTMDGLWDADEDEAIDDIAGLSVQDKKGNEDESGVEHLEHI